MATPTPPEPAQVLQPEDCRRCGKPRAAHGPPQPSCPGFVGKLGPMPTINPPR